MALILLLPMGISQSVVSDPFSETFESVRFFLTYFYTIII